MKKTLVFTLSILFAMAMAVNAQPPSPEEMAKMQTDEMKASLNLTADQLTQVDAINLKYAKMIGEMFEQGPPADFDEMMAKIQENLNAKRVEFEKVLDADQLKKYDQLQEEHRKNGFGGPPM
jgi:hypothetical protein